MNIDQSQRCSSKPIKWKQLIANFNEFADRFGFLSGPHLHGSHIVPRDWKKLVRSPFKGALKYKTIHLGIMYNSGQKISYIKEITSQNG